jgi:hypothetical protein
MNTSAPPKADNSKRLSQSFVPIEITESLKTVILDPLQQELIQWMNGHLVIKFPEVQVKNLGTDLRNGVRLIQLIEV